MTQICDMTSTHQTHQTHTCMAYVHQNKCHLKPPQHQVEEKGFVWTNWEWVNNCLTYNDAHLYISGIKGLIVSSDFFQWVHGNGKPPFLSIIETCRQTGPSRDWETLRWKFFDSANLPQPEILLHWIEISGKNKKNSCLPHTRPVHFRRRGGGENSA